MSHQDNIDEVRRHYDSDPAHEYARIDGRPEFLITQRFMRRHFKPGDRILDVGGGPGRYAHWLAEMGCKVTLADLSPENVRFAKEKAAEAGLNINAVVADARFIDETVAGEYDHVLLMGPLYHLLDEADREQAVRACLKLLKPGGTIWVSFILMFAGAIYMMKYAPDMLATPDPMIEKCLRATINGESYAGDAFTKVYYIDQRAVEPFMARFALEKVHIFGQEGILSPCEHTLMERAPEVTEAWLDFAEKMAEREELLGWTEHLMYVGRKI